MEGLRIKQVNGYWIEDFLGMCFWNLDADDHLLNRLNMENENSRAVLVETYLRPSWESLSHGQQQIVKDSLRYAVNFFEHDDWTFFTSEVLPTVTRHPGEYYADIWGRLFPGEAWHLTDDEGYFRMDEREPSLFNNRFKYSR